MKTRQQQKAHTRQALLQSAYAVYAEAGFSASTNRIAQQAGVSHGTVFLHFPKVDDLLICLIQSFSDSITNQLHEAATRQGELRVFLEMHLDLLSNYEAFYTHILLASDLPAPCRLSFQSFLSALSHHLSQLIVPLQKQEQLKQIKPYMVYNLWIGLVHHYLQNAGSFVESGSVLQARKQELLDSMCNLLST